MGKTTLLFRFLEEIRESARSAFLFDIDPQCEPREIVSYILRDIGIVPGRDGAEMHEQLNSAVVAEARAGRRFVVVIDEAQNLSDAALEVVRMLTNFETPRSKLMQIVLAGQPQLSDKLMKPSLVQLRQRISTFCRIEPFSTEQTRFYIDHRLRFAGYSGAPLFTAEALNRITDASHGIPRNINNLCFNALSLCCALKRKQVDGSMVAEVIADQQLMPDARDTLAAHREPAAVVDGSMVAEVIADQQLMPDARDTLAAHRAPVVDGSMVAEVIADQQLMPDARDTLAAHREPAAVQFYSPERRNWRAGLTRPWVLSVAALLVASALGVGISELRMFRSHQNGYGLALDTSGLPVTLPASASSSLSQPADPSGVGAAKATLDPAHFDVTVEPDQTLEEITRSHLGSYDANLLHQIEALNPTLANPNLIQSGERIRLPGPRAKAALTSAALRPNAEAVEPEAPAPDAPARPVSATSLRSGRDDKITSIQNPLARRSAANSFATAAPHRGAVASGSKKPMVQIAVVARQQDADVLVSALRQRGYGVVVRSEPHDKLLHVQVGPFADRMAATAIKQKLLSDGYNAIIKQ
jgi:type II secretory pathway predicted ATPase ExeA